MLSHNEGCWGLGFGFERLLLDLLREELDRREPDVRLRLALDRLELERERELEDLLRLELGLRLVMHYPVYIIYLYLMLC